MQTEKVCSDCGRALPLTEFYRHNRVYLTGRCKTCHQIAAKDSIIRRYGSASEYYKILYEKNREKIIASNRKYAQAHPEKWKQIQQRSQEDRNSRIACKILQQHAELLKDDPERLSTDFIITTSRIRKEEARV